MTADAMTGLATGKKTERPQDILTPQVVMDFVKALWGRRPVLDPCATYDERGVVDADVEYRGTETGHVDGLAAPWLDCTYVNPPYKDLRTWMENALAENTLFPQNRIVMLCPVRGHRTWWHAVADTAVKVELAPLAFVGYPGTFPAPLCLLVWGNSVEEGIHLNPRS